MNNKKTRRFEFIDQFRGFVGVLMLLGHSSYYLNSIWLQLDPLDPVFPNWGQFALRYAGYLCAPGFLMMAGAMVWWAYRRRIIKGVADWTARWHLIQRGVFLILIQITFINSSWGGFTDFKPFHLGIIACIGLSMILLTLIIKMKWYIRLAFAIAILIVHPFLLSIPFDTENMVSLAVMQTFVDAGSFNKYPVLPWFALAILGSVMATGWLGSWKSDRKKVLMGLLIASVALSIAIALRMSRGFGNTELYSGFGSYSFFLDQKYPPSLFMNLWSFAAVVIGVTLFIVIGRFLPRLLQIFTIPGKVPLFFYAIHLLILGLFVKRFDFCYREGDVLTSLIGLVLMLIIMLPLCLWFYRMKSRSNNYIIKMI